MKNSAKAFVVLSLSLLITFISPAPANQAAPERAHIVILSTTDMHGRVFPIDYYTNTYDNQAKAELSTHYQPYVVKEVQGVRIGVLGLTTPGIPNWENPPNYAGLEFHETVSEANKWVPILREKEKADVVVIAMHMGIEEDLRTGEINPSQVPNENAAMAIARQG